MSDDTELRTPLTDPVRPRHFGAIRVTGRMEIRDLANRKIRDITANVLDARVTVKWLDDIKYRLTCTVDGDADEEIDALHECLAPFLVVHWRDHEGILRTAQGQLGLYIVPPSPVRHSRGAAQAQIDATDVLWGLGTLTARKQTSLTIGTYAGAAAASLLYGQTKIRMSLPTTNEKLVTQRVVKPSENLLAVANEVYTGAGYYELYPTRTGVVTSAPLPEAISKAPVARSIDSRLGDVYEDVDITPDTSRFCNQVFIKSTDPKAGQEMRAGYRITNTDPDSYGSTINTGFVYAKEVADDTDASFDTMKRRARQMLERGSSLDANLAIDVPPDPRFDAHEVWNLHVVRDDGVRVATGQWIVREMEFGLAGNRAGTQRVTLQRRFMLEDLAEMSDRPFGVSADDIELRNQDAKNDAAVDLGAEIVELLGGGNNDVRHYGVGDYDADRTIDVHPNLSRGVGLMEKIAAYGRVGARARPIVTGRVAVDVEDAKGVGYWSRTDTLTTWSSTTGTNITLTEQSDIVTPALYAPTLVIAWGAVDLRAQVSGVQMSAAIRLFSTNTEGVPSEYTTAGGLGPFVETQADTNWHMVPLFHACRFETEFNTAILPIIRLRHSGVTSPSPANQVGDAWVGAIKIPL